MPDLKHRLYELCSGYVARRIATSEEAIVAAREAAVSDGKSSAGDKYETTREMMQQEIMRNEQQLAEARKLKTVLAQINPSKKTDTVQPGSLTATDNGNFYIAIGAGQLTIDGKSFHAIAATSPLGSCLLGKKAGEYVLFNARQFHILHVL
jgi:transcription elongation GreA/GreB family factor